MREVYTAKDPLDAAAMQDFLQAHGILAVVLGEMAFAIIGQAGFGAPTVSVSDEDANRARLLIEEFERTNDRVQEPSWRCPSCDEINEPQFEACWQCGMTRPNDS
jgi:hypothetical protein